MVLLQLKLRFTAGSERDMFDILALSNFAIMQADGIRKTTLSIAIRPLYFALVAPLSAIWPSPQAMDVLNVTVGAIDLFARRGQLARSRRPNRSASKDVQRSLRKIMLVGRGSSR